MESPPPIEHRLRRLDELRGLAVIGMILAHAIFFFHDNSNPLLRGLQQILNMSVLTFFVYIAGRSASRHLDIHSHIPTRHLIGPTLTRVSIIYIAYVVTALVGLVTSLHQSPELITKNVIPALMLIAPPNFTEYLPLFILITLVSLPMRHIYRYTRQSIWLTILLGGCSYLLGITLYPMVLPPVVNELKELFAGGSNLLRFPLLFYFPIYLLGIWWQHASDHVTQAAHARQAKITIMIACGLVSLGSLILSRIYVVPLLGPYTRWPPSLPYLTTGLVIALTSMLFLPALERIYSRLKDVVAYYGRDALDMLVHHILLLFLYKYFIGTQFSDSVVVILATSTLLLLSTVLSSLGITNNISFPLELYTHSRGRFRKRYILMALAVGIVLAWIISQPTGVSPYGGKMIDDPLSGQQVISQSATAKLTANRTWYARHTPETDVIHVSFEVRDTTGQTLAVNPEFITLRLGDKPILSKGTLDSNNITHYSLFVSDIQPGAYTLGASIHNGSLAPIPSNTVPIYVTEPLLVAWTYDWEGWDADPLALSDILSFKTTYPDLRFTHFVHPRTFADGVMSPERKNEIINFLQAQQSIGDEIALHLHMHFDFVSAAGVTPRYTNPWGLRTNEGYDVPTTEYAPEEFKQMLNYAKNQMELNGFSDIQGFRAGGWFLNNDLLTVLGQMNFSYDSSGRNRPTTGAFKNTPWNLLQGAQPYIYTPGNSIVEIPNNGLTTYESSADQLIAHIQYVYRNGTLNQPKTLVYVSHPQFYQREFTKIPQVLKHLYALSLKNDAGPIVFTTMSDIKNLWISQQP